MSLVAAGFITYVVGILILYYMFEEYYNGVGKKRCEKLIGSINVYFSAERKERMNLAKDFRAMEKVYYKAIDKLDSTRADFSIDDKGEEILFILQNMGVFEQWEKGLISTDKILTTINKFDAHDGSNNIVCKKLEKYKDRVDRTYIKFEKEYTKVMNTLENTVVPDYFSYIKNAQKYFNTIAEHENNSVKIVHLYENPQGDVVQVNEKTYDQTIKFINSQKLRDRFRSEEIVNDYTLCYQKSFHANSIRHTFIAPETFITSLKNHYSITKLVIRGDKERYIEDLRDKIHAIGKKVA